MIKYLFFLLTLTVSCKHKSKNSQVNVLSEKFEIPSDSNQSYFYSNRFSAKDSLNADTYLKKWMSQILFYFKEPILYNYKGEIETVRLLWLRSFKNPIVIKVYKLNNEVFLNVKELSRNTATGEFWIKTDKTTNLKNKYWKDISVGIIERPFPSNSIEKLTNEKDGIIWLLESQSNGYNYIVRWDDCHLKSKQIEVYANKLIQLANKTVDIYCK